MTKYRSYIVVWRKTDTEPRAKSKVDCTAEYFQKTYIPKCPNEIEGFYVYNTEAIRDDMWQYIRV